jgi:hypothetical protein
MKWIVALKEWNQAKGGAWCVPRKGTPEYNQVRAIMSGEKPAAAAEDVIEHIPAVEQVVEQKKEDLTTILEQYQKTHNVADLFYDEYNTSIISTVFVLSLAKKLPNVCLYMPTDYYALNPEHYPLSEIMIRVGIVSKKFWAYGGSVHDIVPRVRKCIQEKKDIIAIPVGIATDSSIPKSKQFGHANMLVFRVKQNTFELFEPHGPVFDGPEFAVKNKADIASIYEKAVQNSIASLVKGVNESGEIIKPDWKFIPPSMICPTIGFQEIEGLQSETLKKGGFNGFCQMWSLFYLELVLRFPEMSPSEITKKAMEYLRNKGVYAFATHIISFVKNFEETMLKEIPDINFDNKAQSSKFMDDVTNKFVKWIKKELEEVKLRGGNLEGRGLTAEQKAELAKQRTAYRNDMIAHPEAYQRESFDPSEGGTKQPCSYRPALEKGGLSFKHMISAGYRTPSECEAIQQAHINESERRLYNNMSGFQKFAKGFVDVATKVADFAVKPLELVPGVGRIASQVYQNFAPPGSEYYQDNLIKGVQAMTQGEGKVRGGRPSWAITARAPQTAEQRLELEKMHNPYYGQEMVECPTLPPVKARDGAVIFQGSKAKQTERGRCEAMIRGYESAMKTKQWRDENLGWSGFVTGLSNTVQPVMDVASFLPVVGSVARGISSGIDVAKTATDMAYGDGKGKYAIGPKLKAQLAKIGITPEQYLKKARQAARREGYDARALQFSDNNVHKLMIYDDKGRVRRFGRAGYGDFILWGVQDAAKAQTKRRVFHASHSKIKGDWKNDKFSPNMLALKILW